MDTGGFGDLIEEEEDDFEEEEEEGTEEEPAVEEEGQVAEAEETRPKSASDDDSDASDPATPQEEQKAEPRVPLSDDMLSDGLQMLTPVGTGLSHAYIRLEVRSKELTDLSILTTFIHLRYVDFTTNHIRDISPLNHLQNLMVVRLDENRITCPGLEELPYLQTLSLSENHIDDMAGLNHPLLSRINLAHNTIQMVHGLDKQRLGHLKMLDLRENKLTSTAGAYPPGLRELYMPGNLITDIRDLSSLTHLNVLHLRENSIECLDGFAESMAGLQYINLRGNNIKEFAEVKKLRCLPSLRALVLIDNPIAEEDQYRLEIMLAMELTNRTAQFERLDKEFFMINEYEDAEELKEQKKLALAEQEAEIEEEEAKSEARLSRESTRE